MSALSRRSALTVIAAAGAVPAGAAAAACVQSDAKLFALERELVAAKARTAEACDRYCDTESRFFKLMPKRPERKPPKEYWDLYQTITFGEFGRLPEDHPLKVWDKAIDEEHDAKVRAYDAEHERISELTDVDAARAEHSERSGEMCAIGSQIYATRAHTLAGIMVKVRTAEHLDDGDDPKMLGSRSPPTSVHWLGSNSRRSRGRSQMGGLFL